LARRLWPWSGARHGPGVNARASAIDQVAVDTASGLITQRRHHRHRIETCTVSNKTIEWYKCSYSSETHLKATGASTAIWDHTVLSATRHRWMRPDTTPARQAATRFTPPGGIKGWVDPSAGYVRRWFTYPYRQSAIQVIATRPGIKLLQRPLKRMSKVTTVLVRKSNELQIATFNRQLSDLVGQYSAINLMVDLMYDQLLIADGKTFIEVISDQLPKLIGDQFNRPSNVHG